MPVRLWANAGNSAFLASYQKNKEESHFAQVTISHILVPEHNSFSIIFFHFYNNSTSDWIISVS